MGGNMTRRLMQHGHELVGFDPDDDIRATLASEGMQSAASLEELTTLLEAPRTVWLMVPAGPITDSTIEQLSTLLEPGDTVIDGGNSNYKESMRHGEELAERGIHFVDVGTSGGVWGLKEGYSMMIGGEADVVERHRALFEALAPAVDKGWGHVGPIGAGHFVKMVHNGIEYGLMQAYAEGFEIMGAKDEFGLDLQHVAEIWQHGSVVRSWLLDLAVLALEEDPKLERIQGYVPDSGEGRWTVIESIDLDVPAPVITIALQRRFRSRQKNTFADRMLAALRNQFGGHAVKKAEEE
jgi:6-phosphogluconate dehydrogenase